MALSATQVKEQELILDEAKANVATQALEMKRCLVSALHVTEI